MQQVQCFRPVPWHYVGLTFLPGLIGVLGYSNLVPGLLGSSPTESLHLYGLPVVCAMLVLLGIRQQRRIAPSSLPALGMPLLTLPALRTQGMA